MSIICGLLQLYLFVIFARIVLSWFPIGPDGPMATVQNVTYQLTEPLLGPLRRVIPPVRMGAAALDLSPLVLIFGYTIIMRIIC